MVSEYNKLVMNHQKMEESRQALIDKLRPHIEFEFSVEHYEDSGWMLLDLEQALPITLGSVFDEINKGRVVTSAYINKYSNG